MDKFNKLIEQLDVCCVVIVENDLKIEESIDAILAKYAILSSVNKLYLNSKLENAGYTDLRNKLLNFDSVFSKFQHTVDKVTYLSIGELYPYVDKFDSPEFVTICNELKLEIENQPVVKDIFFQYGITSTSDPIYDPFINQIVNDETYDKCIMLFQNIEGARIDQFEHDLLAAMKDKTKSFLAIVDKMLGNGEPDGIKIANEYLRTISEKNDLISYPFILTSNSTNDPIKFDDYNLLVVSKQSHNIESDICKTVSISAYSKIFSYLEEEMKRSLTKVSEIVSVSRNNIAYIIDKAGIEGILPYEAIKIWYENAVNHYTNQAVKEAGKSIFTSTIGLSKLFEKGIVEDEEGLKDEFKDCLAEISTNEIFDYSVNSKHLPIAPGDIFEHQGRFLVLVGQSCDLLIRENKLSRNLQIAELLDAEFLSKEDVLEYNKDVESKNAKGIKKAKRKANQKIDRFENHIVFKGFKSEDKIGYIQIPFQSNKLKLIDYRILDLTMYNDTGKCEINLDLSLDKNLINYLSKGHKDYYEKIKNEIKQSLLIEGKEDFLAKNISQHISLISYSVSGNHISFPYTRICRLKDNFNKLIHHYYWNYRNRIDINEINLIEEEV